MINVGLEHFRGTRPARTQDMAYRSLLYQLRFAVAKVKADDRLTAEAKAEDIAKLKAEAAAALEKLNAMVEADIKEARREADRKLERPEPDAVALLREAATVRRMERHLAAGRTPIDLATTYAEAGDLESLRALRAETPSLLATAEKHQVADTLSAIDALTRPLLPASERYALADRDAAEWSATAFKMNSGFAAVEVERADSSCTLLMDGSVRKGTVPIGTGWELPAAK